MQGVITHGKQKTVTPGVKIKDDPMFGLMDCLMQLVVNLTMSGVKAVIACHFKILFWDMLDKQLNKINSRKSLFDERIIFMSVIMEGYVIPIVRINSGKGDDRASKVTADIIDNGFGVAEIRLCVNIKTIFVFMVYISFCFFKRGADMLFQFIEQDSQKGFTEVGIIEIFHSAPETVIGISTFGKKAVDVWIPLKRASKGMKDTNKSRDKIFGFVQGEKEFFNDIRNSIKEAVEQAAVFEKKMAEGFVNGEDKMPVGTVDQFKGHSGRPVVGILRATGRTEFGMTAKGDKFKIATMRAAIHGAAIGGISTVDYFFDVFHDNRPWFYIVFNNFIIILENFLYHIHEIIMKQSKAESKPLPLKIEGAGS